jgi:hypothetical protein
VFVSRALHPVVGWLMSWSQGLWLIFFWIGFNAWFALTFAAPVAMTTLGAVTGHPVWINLSNDLLAKHTIIGITTQWWVILFGTVLTRAFAALLIYGSKSYWRVQSGCSASLTRASSGRTCRCSRATRSPRPGRTPRPRIRALPITTSSRRPRPRALPATAPTSA